VFQKPVRSSDRLFTVLARETRWTESRLGLAISVKSAGGAANRNRVKRLVRESFRANRTKLPKLDIVVMSKPGIAGAGNRKITESLEVHWERIGKRCAQSS
jgi:ribonuclease P protein component